MNLEKLLAENMLRYGVKNLSATNMRNIQRLMEQVDPNALAKQGYCIFKKDLVERKLTPKEFTVEAEFANNMVTLEKGLISNNLAAIDAKIKEIVAACTGPLFNAKAFKVEINGQATSANPGTKGPKGVALDHPGGKPYGGLDISKDENKQPGNMYLAKQRAESIKAKLIAALTAAGVNKRLPDLDKRITTTGKVVPGGAAAKGLRVFKVVVYVPEATQDPQFLDGSFCTVSVTYNYTWYSSKKLGDITVNPAPNWTPIFRSSWSINFGVAGIDAGIDYSAAWSDNTGMMGFSGLFSGGSGTTHTGEGSGTNGFLGANGKVDGLVGYFAGSQPTEWVSASHFRYGADSMGGKVAKLDPVSGGATAKYDASVADKFKKWLQSNGHVTATQFDAIKKSQTGLVLSVLAKAGVSGFKKPTELTKLKHTDLKANGGSVDAKYEEFEATISFDEFIELCNGNATPTLTKTTFPEAYIYDLTAKDAAGNPVPTLTAVKDMATEPGPLTNVKRTN